MFVDVVDSADAGTVEGRSCPSFPLEALECMLVFGQLFRQEFQYNGATGLDVFGFAYDAQAPPPRLSMIPKCETV